MSILLDKKTLAIIQGRIGQFQQEQPEIYTWLKDKIEQFGQEAWLIWQAILDYYFWQLVTYPTPSKEQISLFISGNLSPLLEQDFSAFKRKWQAYFEDLTSNLKKEAKEFTFRLCFQLSRVFAPEIIELCSGKSQN